MHVAHARKVPQIAYNLGAALLEMLAQLIGVENTDRLLRTIVKEAGFISSAVVNASRIESLQINLHRGLPHVPRARNASDNRSLPYQTLSHQLSLQLRLTSDFLLLEPFQLHAYCCATRLL